MIKKQNLPTVRNIYHWFDPRHRDIGTWAFILNRLTALGLTFYLFLHLIVLGTLAKGPDAYESFTNLIKSPLFVAGELLIIIAGLYHGLNGIRIVMTSFGIGYAYQKLLFILVVLITIIGSVIFAVRMFNV